MSVEYSAVGATTVVVLSDSEPGSDAWRELIDWLASRAVDGELSLLVVSHGAAPPANERQALVERVLRRHGVRVAVVTDSRVVRGAAAAMSWFLRYPIQCFLPYDAERAMGYLSIADPRPVRDAIAQHEISLGLPGRLLQARRPDPTHRFVPES